MAKNTLAFHDGAFAVYLFVFPLIRYEHVLEQSFATSKHSREQPWPTSCASCFRLLARSCLSALISFSGWLRSPGQVSVRLGATTLTFIDDSTKSMASVALISPVLERDGGCSPAASTSASISQVSPATFLRLVLRRWSGKRDMKQGGFPFLVLLKEYQ